MFSRRASIFCLSTILLISLGIPGLARGNDIEDFLQKLDDYRRDSRERDVQRRRDHERRMRGARRGDFPENYDPRTGIYLRDGEIPSGQYTIELPWGDQNVYVRPEPPPEGPRLPYVPNDVRDQSQALQIVRQLQDSMHHLEDLSDDFDREEWKDIARDAEDALGALEEGIRRGDPQRMRNAFDEFEKKWHPLAYLITRASDLPEPIRRAYHVAVEQDELLHHNLFVTQGPGYDRVRVAALTNQLATQVGRFAKSDPWNSRQIPYQLRRTLRSAERASNDLLESVQANAPVATVTSDYQRFDEAWHEIRQQAWRFDGFDPGANETMQRIVALDRQLHQQLEVESDRGGRRSRTESEIRFARRSADQLAAALSSNPRELRNISRQTQELALALDNLENAYAETGFQGRSISRTWNRARESWGTLQRTIQSIGGFRQNDVFNSLYGQLAVDMRTLESTFSNVSPRHRHPHHPY